MIVFVDGSWYLSPSAHQSVYAAQQLAAGGSVRLPANGSSSGSGSPVGRTVSSSGNVSAGHHHSSHRVVPYTVPSSGHKSPTSVPGMLFTFRLRRHLINSDSSNRGDTQRTLSSATVTHIKESDAVSSLYTGSLCVLLISGPREKWREQKNEKEFK